MNDQLQRLRDLGPELERRHVALGMSQAEFVRAVGMSDTQLRPILKGTVAVMPRQTTLVKGMTYLTHLGPLTWGNTATGRRTAIEPLI